MMAESGTKPLRLGILGMSPGNGHPYSWAAIFNGFDAAVMADCPFPAIPDYLSRQHYPADFLSSARVTHLWTQDRTISEHIAAASRIDTVVDSPEAMIGHVDAILLARDDAENHLGFARPLLEAGLPIYVDKPLAVSRQSAETFLAHAIPGRPVFSCSALRYAQELKPDRADIEACGTLRFVDAYVPGKWATYAIHVIEPVLTHIVGAEDKIADVRSNRFGDIVEVVVTWQSGLVTRFSSLGASASQIGFTIYGEKANRQFIFKDAFAAFRSALRHFVGVVQGEEPNIPLESTLRAVDIIELGNRS